MARHTLNRLSARTIATAVKPGRYVDGGGLHLVVAANGSRKWVFRYTAAGKQRDMGLGAARDVPLTQARQLAGIARDHVRAGRDPMAERDALRLAAAGTLTFGEMADMLLDKIEHGFRNAKHRAQWRMTLNTYAKPIRSKPVDRVGTADVLQVLQPIWFSKPETASRLRGRMERVLDAAKAKGYRSGENPARWRGHLDALLPKRSKLTRGHHAAIPFGDLPKFIATLRDAGSVTASALEFLILTAGRSGEVLGAGWDEVDLDGKLWTIPATRMKGAREHRVPLCKRAMFILHQMQAVRSGDYIFPGGRPSKPLSQMALAMALRRIGASFTVHGFRSAFRDWAGERTRYPRELAEAALAHVVGDATERAYRRGDALERRREMMEAWAAFCEPKPANVVPIAQASTA